MTPMPITSRTPFGQLRRRRGDAVSRLRSFSDEDRAILLELLIKEQDLIESPEFEKPDAERRLYDEAEIIEEPDTSWYHPVMDDLNLTRDREKSSKQVLLTAAQERVLFLKYNYSRFVVRSLQREVWASADKTPTDEQARELVRWKRRANVIREQIANINLALVLAMAKRTRMSEVDFADLVSEGNMALLRAVDKFDCERGFKFSTYGCRAILKAFSRQGMKLSKYRQRFPTDFDPKLERSDYLETKRAESVRDTASEVRRIVDENRADLSEIERTIIEHRFGFDDRLRNEKPMTLEQIGQIIGVTKERVRQIQNKALDKIRDELEESYINGKHAQEHEVKLLPEIIGYGLN